MIGMDNDWTLDFSPTQGKMLATPCFVISGQAQVPHTYQAFREPILEVARSTSWMFG